MDIRILKTPEDFSRYDTWVKSHPQGNLWQSLEWKRYQEALGREVRIYVAEEGGNFIASALVVIDRTTGGFCTWDIPRGPLWLASGLQIFAGGTIVHALIGTIICAAREEYCCALYLSLHSLDIAKIYQLEASTRHEQPTATRIVDLTKTEDEILTHMHPKGRYNIHIAQKNGVRVEQATDGEAFYGLLQQTAGRDEFRILPLKAYKAFLECLPGSFLLLAYERMQKNTLEKNAIPSFESFSSFASFSSSHRPIAGLMGVVWGQTGIYYYGASDYVHRTLMAPYALQWEAMRLCKAKGCTMYDLLGIAPPSPLTPHPWAGVSAFKEKFGGTVATYPPEQQIVLQPLLWKLLQWKRRILG